MSSITSHPARLTACHTDSIVRIQGSGMYSLIFTGDGKKALSCYTLKRYEENLPEFVRISKSHMVNPDFVQSFRTLGAECLVVLLSGEELPVSRRRESIVLYKLNHGVFDKRRQLA